MGKALEVQKENIFVEPVSSQKSRPAIEALDILFSMEKEVARNTPVKPTTTVEKSSRSRFSVAEEDAEFQEALETEKARVQPKPNPSTLYSKGEMSYYNRDLTTAEENFRAAAIEGHADAQYDLGLLLLHSQTGEKYTKWWRLAAAQGHKEAKAGLDSLVHKALRPQVLHKTVSQEGKLGEVMTPFDGFKAEVMGLFNEFRAVCLDSNKIIQPSQVA